MDDFERHSSTDVSSTSLWLRWQSSRRRRSTRGPSVGINNNGYNEHFVQKQSAHDGVNQRSKDVTQTQQQRPESPAVTLTWHASKYKVHELHQRYILRSFCCLFLCDIFRALINSIVCWFCTSALGLVLFQIVLKQSTDWINDKTGFVLAAVNTVHRTPPTENEINKQTNEKKIICFVVVVVIPIFWEALHLVGVMLFTDVSLALYSASRSAISRRQFWACALHL